MHQLPSRRFQSCLSVLVSDLLNLSLYFFMSNQSDITDNSYHFKENVTGMFFKGHLFFFGQ